MKPLQSVFFHCNSVKSVTSACQLSKIFVRHFASSTTTWASLPKAKQNKMATPSNYNSWTKTGLIERVKQLEAELRNRPSLPPPPTTSPLPEAGTEETPAAKKPKGKRKMDPSRYSTRYIALKLAYLGKNYGGFEFQAMGNQPAIEEELWNALTKACLIFPQDEKVVEWDCCDYSKCGRTDRGVSAFGQVIGIKVRSNRPLPKKHEGQENNDIAVTRTENGSNQNGGPTQSVEEEKPFHDIYDEIAYPRVLNRLLPPEIRILAWCPSPPPEFSARFSCRERQYRYFFTQPAFSPEIGPGDQPVKTGWLDIDAMRDAAKRYEGEHDFRNVCKIDPAKLITNWKRTIFESDIVEVKDINSALPYLETAGLSREGLQEANAPKVYYFHVRGSAFLWHQIRHMVSLLFLVGQGLEKPSIISEILDVDKNPAKPSYVMADEVPLVLWDCIFPDLSNATESTLAGQQFQDTLQWIYVGDESLNQENQGQFNAHGIMDSMWQDWREKKMDELLSNRLLQHMADQLFARNNQTVNSQKSNPNASVRVFEGANFGRSVGKYIPVMQKSLMESPEVQNDRYAKRKGFADAEDMRAQRSSSKLAKETPEVES